MNKQNQDSGKPLERVGRKDTVVTVGNFCGATWYSPLSRHCLHLEVYSWEVKMAPASLRPCLLVQSALYSTLHRDVLSQKYQVLHTYRVLSRSAKIGGKPIRSSHVLSIKNLDIFQITQLCAQLLFHVSCTEQLLHSNN